MRSSSLTRSPRRTKIKIKKKYLNELYQPGDLIKRERCGGAEKRSLYVSYCDNSRYRRYRGADGEGSGGNLGVQVVTVKKKQSVSTLYYKFRSGRATGLQEQLAVQCWTIYLLI